MATTQNHRVQFAAKNTKAQRRESSQEYDVSDINSQGAELPKYGLIIILGSSTKMYTDPEKKITGHWTCPPIPGQDGDDVGLCCSIPVSQEIS
jgi:hypothetical protein